MKARGMVRATARGFTCVDCGALLGEHEALLCQRCDRDELEELRAMHAPEPPQTVAGYMKAWSAELRARVQDAIVPRRT